MQMAFLSILLKYKNILYVYQNRHGIGYRESIGREEKWMQKFTPHSLR